MNKIFAVGMMAMGLGGCATNGGGVTEAAAPASSPIERGEVDPGDDAVGLVVPADAFLGGCTGTLVAPNVVLTAAHCINPAPVTFYTGRGMIESTPGTGMVPHAVAAARAYPGYVANSDGSCPNPASDLALVLLKEPIMNITPLHPAASLPATGDACMAVGFGDHLDADSGHVWAGEKRNAMETVTSILALDIKVSAGTGIADHGDSGGPLLCAGAIVAVTSCHDDGFDPDTHTTEYYARVDVASSWIAAAISDWKAAAGGGVGAGAPSDAGGTN